LISVAADAFDYVESGTVKISGFSEPCVVIEIDRVDDERIAFPVTDGFSVIGGIGVRIMLASIHRYHPVRIARENLYRKIIGMPGA